jgi:uncharacterized protein YndB with AHSA1/START domain
MPDIKHLVHLKAPIETVYAALATEDGLKSWWTADSSVQDDKADFGFYNRAVVFHMTIEELKPNSRIVWKCHGDDPDWKDTTLIWELRAEGDGTTLLFTHAGWRHDDEHFASSNSTWGMLMYHLKDRLEGRASGPKWAS